ncbi:MAG: type VI secretion system protein ImpE [Planctomycetota bacterium]|jgi:type VI secretion system protein ImpE
MEARDLYDQGKLSEAISKLNEDVKGNPTDKSARGFLAVLLCFQGNLERADKQLNAMVKMDPEAEVGISLMRQLIRAEQARQQFFNEGRLPEFLATPIPRTELQLKASVSIRDKNLSEANDLLAQAEELRGETPGQAAGESITDFRDADDLIGGHLEVLTSTGKYYWIPAESFEELEFHKPERPRDLLWRRASATVTDGPTGDIYIPTIYAPVREGVDESSLLGRSTEWLGGDGEPMRGSGLRTFIVGEEAKTVLELTELSFAAQGAAD